MEKEKKISALDIVWQELQDRIQKCFMKGEKTDKWSWDLKKVEGDTFTAEISLFTDQATEHGRLIKVKFQSIYPYNFSNKGMQGQDEVFLFLRYDEVSNKHCLKFREWKEIEKKWMYPLRMFKTPIANVTRTVFVHKDLEWDHIKAQIILFLIQLHNGLFKDELSGDCLRIQSTKNLGIIRKNSQSKKKENMYALFLSKEEIDYLFIWFYKEYLGVYFSDTINKYKIEDPRSFLLPALINSWSGGQRWSDWKAYIGSTLWRKSRQKTEKSKHTYGISDQNIEENLSAEKEKEKTFSSEKDEGRTSKALASSWGYTESTVRRWCRRGLLKLDPTQGDKIPEMYTQKSIEACCRRIQEKKDRKKAIQEEIKRIVNSNREFLNKLDPNNPLDPDNPDKALLKKISERARKKEYRRLKGKKQNL